MAHTLHLSRGPILNRRPEAPTFPAPPNIRRLSGLPRQRLTDRTSRAHKGLPSPASIDYTPEIDPQLVVTAYPRTMTGSYSSIPVCQRSLMRWG
jgi:hypothetical protein